MEHICNVHNGRNDRNPKLSSPIADSRLAALPNLARRLTFALAMLVSCAALAETFPLAANSPWPPEQLGGLLSDASMLQEQERHEEAIATLREALQTARMTLGLYHEAQLAIVDSLIDSEAALSNWHQVDDYHALLLGLYQNLYAEDPGKLEQGLARVQGWHVDALRNSLDGRAISHLRQARQLLKLRLQLATGAATADLGKIARLREGVEFAEAYLAWHSDSNRNRLRERQESRREALLSNLR